MLVVRKIGEGSNMQERVQSHYGRSTAASELPPATAADHPSRQPALQAATNPGWQAALADAMARTGALAEVQAALREQERLLAERERQLAQREQAMQPRQAQADELFGWRTMLYGTGR